MATISQRPAIITTQPQTLVVANPFFDHYQEWSTDLFDCCDDVGQCCYAHFCWSCFLGSLAEKINESQAYGFCCGDNILVAYRMKVRATLKIRGDACSDVCAVTWCSRCVGLQMHNELKNRGLA